jgi:hypothetical protein
MKTQVTDLASVPVARRRPAAKTRAQLQDDLLDCITSSGGPFADWYVGTCADTEQRLFQDHKLDPDGDIWIRRRAASSRDAREIEIHFLELGAQGGPGDGGDGVHVYAYRMAAHTVEELGE